LPSLALLVRNYIDDLARGQLGESAFYGWLTEFFAVILLTGLELPLAQAGFITDQNYVAPNGATYLCRYHE
jgi:hypothetical protein